MNLKTENQMNKINSIIIGAAILLLTNCSGFLEEDNKAGITNDDLYATEEGYETLRINAYANMRTIFRECPLTLVAGTDLYQKPRSMGANGIYDYMYLYDTNGDVLTFYTNCYLALQAFNTAEYYLSIAEISADKKTLYQAEYDFLKGFVHFLLIEQFGGIVINDEYTQSPRMNMPRASLAESYEYVIGKMEAALPNLPQTEKNGQICKDIVNHYLAKVYLTRGWDMNHTADFDKAKNYANAVLNTRGDLKYSMEELWSPTNDNNDEVIFAVQFDANSIATNTSGNNQEAIFGFYLGGTERNHKYMAGSMAPTWALHSWYDKNDARYEATFMLSIWEYYYDYYQGKNTPGKDAITAIYPRAWDKSAEMFEDYIKLTEGVTADGQFKNVTMTTEDTKQLVEGAIEFLQKWCPEYKDVPPIAAVDEKGNNYLKIYPFFEHLESPIANEKYWRTGYNSDFCQPNIKKFDMDKLVVFSQTQSYRDIVLASLSETMLLYAEACIGQGDYPTAETYINKVLARPGNAKDGGTLRMSLPASKEDALEAYLKESGKELAGQYCGRWPELRRTGMLKHMVYKYNYDFAGSPDLGSDAIGQKVYRPIPQAAITINEGLSAADQNPGY